MFECGLGKTILAQKEEDGEEEESIVMEQLKEVHVGNPSSCCTVNILKSFPSISRIGLRDLDTVEMHLVSRKLLVENENVYCMSVQVWKSWSEVPEDHGRN